MISSFVVTLKLEVKGTWDKVQNFVNKLATASQGRAFAETVTIEGICMKLITKTKGRCSEYLIFWLN